MSFAQKFGRGPESNSLSLAMFASVGFHAVLFVGMALIPASSEPKPRPLRIVNLLPPSQQSAASQTQANTATLDYLLQNPLPDLSANAAPPLGNADSPGVPSDPNAAVFNGNRRGFGSVDTSKLLTKNAPNQSFTSLPSSPRPPVSSPASPSVSSPALPPSSLEPATKPPVPAPLGALPPIGTVPDVGAGAPEPGRLPAPTFPGGVALNPRGGSLGGGETPGDGSGTIPPSLDGRIPILPLQVAYNYPQEACAEKLQGTATVAHYRDPNGNYVAGSEEFEDQSGISVLDSTAVSAVKNQPVVGNGQYQRYVSRFDFTYSESACSAKASPPSSPAPSVTPGASTTPASDSTPTPSPTPSAPPPSKASPSPSPSPQPQAKPSQSDGSPPVRSPQPSAASQEAATSSTQPKDPAPQPTVSLPPASPSSSPAGAPGSAQDLVLPDPAAPGPASQADPQATVSADDSEAAQEEAAP
ncbi:hypothetical protein [Lyngbya confervoides]|uniref:TonB C-terminal domain-containing protein n=1 Tax=Lyngbya confervoides BDU141951 TaxID=1574623 RepID=A0ABD4T8U5_9CYAN|nr:hypothetical protein [Lyngbya confervoides]MCM1985056.1 hypothetical protein [Lyngbya confervoides BDU141951]